MSDSTSLLNMGELSRPATVLIEKISDAVGGIAKPWQIRRVAKAEADADKIRAVSNIEIDELQRRALQRFIMEEARKQRNIEEITAKALLRVVNEAQPENIEDDWIANFFDRCRLISDEEMQTLWSKLLAGEANSPGTYSKRTVNLLGSLDKSDASLFQSLCGFCWSMGHMVPLIYDVSAEIYTRQGINFSALKHLDEIGLLSFEPLISYNLNNIPKRSVVYYYERPVYIEFDKENDNEFRLGHVMLSKTGQELAPICDSGPVPGFYDFIFEYWEAKRGMHVSSSIRVVPGDDPA